MFLRRGKEFAYITAFEILFFSTSILSAQIYNSDKTVNINRVQSLGSAVISGENLYALKQSNKSHSGDGVLFTMHDDGTDYKVLHLLHDTDAAYLSGSVLLQGAKLYGMALYSGESSYEVIYSIDTNGYSFNVLHRFAVTTIENPYGNLTIHGNSLLGMVSDGRNDELKMLFSINTDGTGYKLIRNFNLPDNAPIENSSVLVGNETFYNNVHLNQDNASFPIVISEYHIGSTYIIEIQDVFGRIVYKSKLLSEFNTVDLNDLINGTYTYKILSEDENLLCGGTIIIK